MNDLYIELTLANVTSAAILLIVAVILYLTDKLPYLNYKRVGLLILIQSVLIYIAYLIIHGYRG